MKIRILSLAFLLMAIAIHTSAQSEFNIEEITVINLGDGRMMHRTRQGEKPIDGERRIIDGRRSEYILANFSGGLYDGTYQHFKSNKLREEGSYKEGRKNGLFKEYNSDGTSVKSQKTYKDGQVDGMWTTYFTNGAPDREKEYRNGVEYGIERKYDYESGDLITEMNFVDGKKHGRQKQQITSNIQHYVILSNYNAGVLDGDYSETYLDGTVRKKGAYKNGKENGKWQFYTTQGTPEKEINYKDGKQHGEYRKYFADGTVSSIDIYADGKQNGVSKEFYYETNGQLSSEYTYVNGRKDGPYKVYSKEGLVTEEGRVENGTRVPKGKTQP